MIEKGFVVTSLSKTVEQANKIFTGVQVVLALFGGIALIVSAIGMFNTMTVTLLERTKEIGIRKAIGASPASVIRLILYESVLITGIAGIVGLLLGMGLLFIVDKVITQMIEGGADQMNYIFNHPQADFNIAISATIIL